MKRLLLAFVLALASVVTVLAQDPTAEPSPVVTEESETGGVNIEVNPPAATDPLPEGNVSIPGWSIVVVVVLAIAGGASLPSIIEQIRGNPNAIAEIEARAGSVPDTVADTLVKASEVIESTAKLVKEAFDRVPAAEKPPVQVILKQVDSADMVAELTARGYTVSATASAGG